MQKTVSILSGLILLILLLFSLDLESFLMKSNRFSSFYQRVFAGLSGRLSTLAHTRPLILGIANGFLPCGLVYLALAASLSTGSIFGGAIFMTLFGLGTLPAMLSFGLGGGQLLSRKLPSFRKYILPAMQLVLGLYLIARGMNIPFPATLDFDQALRNPVMCH